MLQCKKERVNYYQSKLASLSEQDERRMTKMDIADDLSKSLEKRGHQSPCPSVDNGMCGEFVSSPKITPARKRTQTSEYINLPTRKSARLAGKNA